VRRGGYFATVVGARAPVAGALRPPRRVFALQRGFVRVSEPVAAAVDPEGRHAEPEDVVESALALVPESREVVEAEMASIPASRTPGPRAVGPEAQRASVRRAALTELQVPVEPSGIPRTNSDPRATGLRSLDAVGIETARELPVAEAIVRATADSRHTTPPAKQTGQGARTPQLHIGAIDVTVVAPPAPESKAKPAASSPSRLPTVPARRMPWFGLAQR